MEKLENNFLYLVVLGGRAEKANIELHDVRWVVGSKIEYTFDTLRKSWFGSSKCFSLFGSSRGKSQKSKY